MPDKMEIRSAMHPMPHTIGPQQSLKIAKQLLLEHGIRHLPVKDGNQLVGILSDRDIDFALAVEKRSPEEMLVKDAYMPDPYSVSPNVPVAEVARRMAHDHIGCALVVEEHRLIGIFTAVDACRVLGEVLSGRTEQ